MTGELYDVLARHSLLRASVQAPAGTALDLNVPEAQAAFLEGVDRVARDGLAGSLFQVRTRAVLRGAAPALNLCFLSGLLIGSEVVEVAVAAAGARLLLAAPPATSLAYQLAIGRHARSNPLEVVAPEALASASILGHRLILRSIAAAPNPFLTP
jgi:2-dehydro-3-deoxygalactonokinase